MSITKIDFMYTQNVKVITKEQFEVHEKLYEGYINKVNEIQSMLETNGSPQQANSTYSVYRGLKRGETFALDGVILHELYFENIEGINKHDPQVRMQAQPELFNKYFGTYQKWEDDFKATAKASRGWVVLAYEQRSGKLINISLDIHDYGMIAFAYPILVLDVYEHAYYIDYKSDKNAYINKFMNSINWDVVEKRIEKL